MQLDRLGVDSNGIVKHVFPTIVAFKSYLYALVVAGLRGHDDLRIFRIDTTDDTADWEQFIKLPAEFEIDPQHFSMSMDTKKGILHIIGSCENKNKYGVLDLNDKDWNEKSITHDPLLLKCCSCYDSIQKVLHVVGNYIHYRVDAKGRKRNKKTYKLTGNASTQKRNFIYFSGGFKKMVLGKGNKIYEANCEVKKKTYKWKLIENNGGFLLDPNKIYQYCQLDGNTIIGFNSKRGSRRKDIVCIDLREGKRYSVDIEFGFGGKRWITNIIATDKSIHFIKIEDGMMLRHEKCTKYKIQKC